MNRLSQGWTHLQRDEGSDFLKWIDENKTLHKKFDVLANALDTLLRHNVRTECDACTIWAASPAALARCNDQTTYAKPGAPTAYAWLHLLDRYVRTWLALERLLEESCLPMGKYGVRVLDVGTGPGPSAFAIHDFYNAAVEFAAFKQDERWIQPVEITCVEFDSGTNHFRHQLAELIYEGSKERSKNVLAMCNALPDFGEHHPSHERKQSFQRIRNEEDAYYDEVANEWVSELRYSSDEAHEIAQSLHRYRLVVFSNFLTTMDSVKSFEPNIVEVLHDANPGTVLLIIGGNYPDIYRHIDKLTVTAGFLPKIKRDCVTSENSELSDRIYQEEQRFYEYLKNLVPGEHYNDPELEEIRNYFENSCASTPRSQVRAYRK